MPEFKSLDAAAKADVLTKIAEVLKANDLGDVPISQTREMVYNASAQTYEDNQSVSISKDLPASDEAKATKVMAELKPILEENTGIDCKIVAKIGAGDPYKTITGAKKLGDTESTDMTHDGQAWLIDFWATWCPPCQAPMQHNVDMIKKKGDAWAGKVRIIGLSIDQDMASVDAHVKTKGWESVDNWHRDKSDCSAVYSVQGVPHVMLIDKTGRIVFKGHPATRKNLEQDLDDLSEGKALTGDGVFSAPAEVKEGEEKPAAAVPEGFSEMDKATIEKETAEIATVLEGFTKDEKLVEQAKGCPRAFCVIVLQENFTPSTGKTLFKYENFRVVVGPKENIDQLKATFEDKVKGTFTPVLREQAI